MRHINSHLDDLTLRVHSSHQGAGDLWSPKWRLTFIRSRFVELQHDQQDQIWNRSPNDGHLFDHLENVQKRKPIFVTEQQFIKKRFSVNGEKITFLNKTFFDEN